MERTSNEIKNVIKESMKRAEERQIMCLHGVYLDFKGMLEDFTTKNAREMHVETLKASMNMTNMGYFEGAAFMSYILKEWNVFAFDIIKGKYKYMNVTDIVYQAWLEDVERFEREIGEIE